MSIRTFTIPDLWRSIEQGQFTFPTDADDPAAQFRGVLQQLSQQADLREPIQLYEAGDYQQALRLLEKLDASPAIVLLKVLCLLHLHQRREKAGAHKAINYLRDKTLPEVEGYHRPLAKKLELFIAN